MVMRQGLDCPAIYSLASAGTPAIRFFCRSVAMSAQPIWELKVLAGWRRTAKRLAEFGSIAGRLDFSSAGLRKRTFPAGQRQNTTMPASQEMPRAFHTIRRGLRRVRGKERLSAAIELRFDRGKDDFGFIRLVRQTTQSVEGCGRVLGPDWLAGS